MSIASAAVRFEGEGVLLLRVAVSAFTVGALALGADAAHGQEKYPGKLIRIVTAAPGSNHDWGARLTAQELTPRIGQRVIVENRGSIAVEHVAKDAPADGSPEEFTLFIKSEMARMGEVFGSASFSN